MEDHKFVVGDKVKYRSESKWTYNWYDGEVVKVTPKSITIKSLVGLGSEITFRGNSLKSKVRLTSSDELAKERWLATRPSTPLVYLRGGLTYHADNFTGIDINASLSQIDEVVQQLGEVNNWLKKKP